MAGSPANPWDEAPLRDAALAYVALYPTTAAGLERVLLRRVARALRADYAGREDYAAATASAEVAVRAVVARMVALGVVDDAAFARARARRLARSGKSRRAIVAHLAAHGVGKDVIKETVEADPATELSACLAFARRRKIGPFRNGNPPDEATKSRELAACARAGFSARVATRTLALDRARAEEEIRATERSSP